MDTVLMNWHLHISTHRIGDDKRFVESMVIEVDKWANGIGERVLQCHRPIDFLVYLDWSTAGMLEWRVPCPIGESPEKLGWKWNGYHLIDDETYYIHAGDLVGVRLICDEAHADRLALAKAQEALINALPSDWPIVARYL